MTKSPLWYVLTAVQVLAGSIFFGVAVFAMFFMDKGLTDNQVEWWKSRSGVEVQCQYDFYRLQRQVYTGEDFGCSRSAVQNYFNTGGFGWDPAIRTVCLNAEWLRQEEYQHNIVITCYGLTREVDENGNESLRVLPESIITSN